MQKPMEKTKKIFTYTILSGAALGTMAQSAYAHVITPAKLSPRELQQKMVEQTKLEMKKQFDSFVNIGLIKPDNSLAKI